MGEQPRRPEVTLTGSSGGTAPSAAAEGPEDRPARSRLLLLLPLLAVAVAVLSGRGGDPEPPPPSLDAELVLLGERLSVTQSGILVVPVELRNRGEALQVRSAEAYASPVREDPVVQAPQDIGTGERRRFVTLVAPDCRLLRAGSPLEFSAGVLLRVGRGSASTDLVLDVAADTEVRDRVAGLCA